MQHPLLDSHSVLGWDIDGTLVDGPNSALLRSYLIGNPHKKHHLITFRDHAWAQQAYAELASYGVPVERITSVSDCPQDLYIAYSQQKTFYDEAKVDRFERWKGKKAAELGCTVLIDDMEALVIKGCLAHGVAFINAYDPLWRALSDR